MDFSHPFTISTIQRVSTNGPLVRWRMVLSSSDGTTTRVLLAPGLSSLASELRVHDVIRVDNVQMPSVDNKATSPVVLALTRIGTAAPPTASLPSPVAPAPEVASTPAAPAPRHLVGLVTPPGSPPVSPPLAPTSSPHAPVPTTIAAAAPPRAAPSAPSTFALARSQPVYSSFSSPSPLAVSVPERFSPPILSLSSSMAPTTLSTFPANRSYGFDDGGMHAQRSSFYRPICGR